MTLGSGFRTESMPGAEGLVDYDAPTMRTRILVSILALGALGACKTTTEHAPPVARTDGATAAVDGNAAIPDEGILEEGRELTRQFYEREFDALWDRMAALMVEALGSKEELAKFRGQIDVQLGSETEVLDEKVVPTGPFRAYVRKASFSNVGVPAIVQWTLDTEGKIAGFFIRPAQ